MKVLSVSVTERGAATAGRLPYEHVAGDAGDTIRSRWSEVDAFVCVLATGATVRIVAPLLGDKATDPAVVCVDEAGRYAVALCGGHAGGANTLAREVAALLGAEPVITTATDATGIGALDTIPGFVATGDLAGVTTHVLDGLRPALVDQLDWPLPRSLRSITIADADADAGTDTAPPAPAGGATDRRPGRIVVTDRSIPAERGTAVLHPPSLVVGVGSSSGAPVDEVAGLVRAALADAGLAAESVSMIATVDLKAGEPGIVALATSGPAGRPLPLRTFTADALAGVEVPTPSEVVHAAVGTPSVAEAAALLAAGPGAGLVVAKRKSGAATVAVARRAGPAGHLSLIGLGPGGPAHRTPAAAAAVVGAEVVIGYGPYLDQCADLLGPHQELLRSPIGDEVVRAKQCLTEAAAGRRVAMVCSGDAGVYAMASIVLEVAGEEAPGLDIEVVPGVTAALASAAALGAPLGHDHVSISLSDLLTPWEHIEGRLRAAAESDLVVSFYNPRSAGRHWQLDAARTILLTHRPPTTPVGIVTDAGRDGMRVGITTLADLDVDLVGMTTCVVVGSSTTRIVDGRIVTPRGYRP